MKGKNFNYILCKYQIIVYRYMTRRCKFLDCHPDFNFNPGKGVNPGNPGKDPGEGVKRNTNTEKLGSTMMRTMLKEVHEFCDPSTDTQKSHQQV